MAAAAFSRWWVVVNCALEREWVRGRSNCWAVDDDDDKAENRVSKRKKQRRESVEAAILIRETTKCPVFALWVGERE